MKPSMIPQVLDLAQELRLNGKVYNPCFAGDAGIGKSEICQQWVANKRKDNPNFWFYDLRLAYLEAPDLIGLNKIVEKRTKEGLETRSTNILPDFWPAEDSEAEGLLLIEEPNKAQPDILNAMMQLLTDRVVHKYKLPKGIVIAACINPDNGNYDVTSMDTALKNRFEFYEVKYNKQDHLAFMKEHNYHPNIVNFVESGSWNFKPVEEIGTEGIYVSPRTFSKVQSAYTAKSMETASDDFMYEVLCASLGKPVATALHKFCNESKPLVAEDFKGRKLAKSLETLAQHSQPGNYRGDLLSITIKSVSEAYPGKIKDEVLVKIADILPADLSVSLLNMAWGNYLEQAHAKDPERKNHMEFKDWIKNFPEFMDSLRTRLKGSGKTEDKSAKEEVKEEAKEETSI